MKNPLPGLLDRAKGLVRRRPKPDKDRRTPPAAVGTAAGTAAGTAPGMAPGTARGTARGMAGTTARGTAAARKSKTAPLLGRFKARLAALGTNESGAAPNWFESIKRGLGFGGEEPADINVYRDANRDWAERRRSPEPGGPEKPKGYTWRPPAEQPPKAQPAKPVSAGPAPDRRAPFGRAATASAQPSPRGAAGEWVLPQGPGAAGQADAGSAFGGSLPKPLAALTDRLTRFVEGSQDFSQRFVDALDRIAHSTKGRERAPVRPSLAQPSPAQPAPAAPGGGWRASLGAAGAGADRGFFGAGAGQTGEWSDAELIQDAKEASRRETSHLARTLLRFVVLFFVVFAIWAALFRIDEVTRGDGKVIASSQTQILGNLEGGVVREVLVREGDRVNKGDVLMRLDNAQAVANFRENRVKYLTLLAQVSRLGAELKGTPVGFPAEVATEAPEVVRAESALMAARISQFEAQMQILRQQRTQRAQDLADLRNKADKSGQQLRLVREQLRILEPLAEEGLAPRVEVIRNQRDLAQTAGELESAQLQIPKAEAALREADRKIDERLDAFRSDTQKELNDKTLQLDQTREVETGMRDRVTRTELRAPLNGVVKQIYIKTIGGAVKPGQDLVEVVPSEDTLLVEVKVRPADVGFVSVGQKANVKVSAYDYSLFGTLDATVEDISADTFVDERAGPGSEPYFRVRLRTKKSFVGTQQRPLPISPGMVVTADILTGERTVLTYLTKPFFKTVTSALGER